MISIASLVWSPKRSSSAAGLGRAVVLMAGLLLTQAGPAALPFMADGDRLPSLAPMLERVTPAVVNIATEGRVRVQQNPLLNDPFFRRFFDIPDMPRERKTQSLGSGVIVDAKRGLVITNNHVIANADQITVKLRDGRQLVAQLIGTDPETDIAVIQIEAKGLTAVRSTDSDRLRVGDFVVAIGNPFGLGQTVTSGIVSALGRTGLGIEGYEDFIQTDASINPGNSGGALVNLNGDLVGINTAIFSQSGGNVGIGFAIPSNMVDRITEQLVKHGEVERGIVGVQVQDLDPELASAFNIAGNSGAVVVSVVPGSAADKAGLEPGDVIVAVEGKPIERASDVRNRIGLLRVGERFSLDFVRDGRRQSVNTKVGKHLSRAGDAHTRDPRLAGGTFGEIPRNSNAYNRIEGVMLLAVETGSRLWANGLREGDIVTSVNRTPVPGVQAFVEILKRLRRTELLFRVLRGNSAAFVVIE